MYNNNFWEDFKKAVAFLALTLLCFWMLFLIVKG